MKARRLTLIVAAVLAGLLWNVVGWRFTFGLVGAFKNYVSTQFPGESLAENTRIIFPQATVNGRPARLMLDTGASSAAFTDAGATRLGVKIALPAGISPIKLTDNTGLALSESARVTVSAETFTAPVLVLPYNLADVDGSIGWPEVRDNLLVFDPTTRTVHSVEKLPPETSGWLKLKISPSNVLVLETALPNGHAADIAVDTGADYGVALAPAQWQEWRAAHPNATINTASSFMPGAGGWKVDESFADNLQLGALTLTAVSVRQANQAELATTGNYVGSLGLDALAHMDLVFDGKNGVAYLRLRPVPARPSAQSQDWTVTGPVSVKFDALLVIAGQAKSAQGDYVGALADINHALEINPDNEEALAYRGASRNNNHDFAGAIADYTRALDLDPNNAEVYADRGNAKRNQGDHDGALADFNRALELNPQNATALLARANLQMQKDPKGAIADFDEYLKINSKDALAYAHRAGAQYNQGDYAAAVADYGHALDLDPKNATTWLWRGYSNARLGDAAAAIADFTQALALDPKNSRAYSNRGYAREVQGNFEDALADYDQAIALNPNDSIYPPLHRRLLQLRLGQAPTGISAIVAGWKAGWPKSIGQYLLGDLDETALLAAAAYGTPAGPAPGQALFVTNHNNGTIGKYAAATGVVINASFIMRLDGPVALIQDGPNLLVSTTTATSFNGIGAISVYNANTGALVNAALVSGLSGPVALALSGSNLYVSNKGSGTVGEYNVDTGATINAALVSGLHDPTGLVVSGSDLYVASLDDGTIAEYNATTGALVNAMLVSGLHQPTGLELYGSNLLVASQAGNAMGEYAAATGVPVNASFIPGVNGFAGFTKAGGYLFIANQNDNSIVEYNAATGAVVNPAFAAGLHSPQNVVVFSEPSAGPPLAGAGKTDAKMVEGQQCEAYYYIGIMRLLKGDQPGARDFFNKAVATGQQEHYEYQFARAELARLDAAR